MVRIRTDLKKISSPSSMCRFTNVEFIFCLISFDFPHRILIQWAMIIEVLCSSLDSLFSATSKETDQTFTCFVSCYILKFWISLLVSSIAFEMLFLIFLDDDDVQGKWYVASSRDLLGIIHTASSLTLRVSLSVGGRRQYDTVSLGQDCACPLYLLCVGSSISSLLAGT